jgi:NDP-sugar pyrophosphorylase family protein
VDLIPSGEQFDFPDVVHVLLERDLPVAAYRSSDFWLDIGRREDYELAQECFGELRGESSSPRREGSRWSPGSFRFRT